MQAVTGIGGFFFRAGDGKALSAWYAEHLGIAAGDQSMWMQEAGPTVFAPFREESDYFAADRRWMLNLRVRDMDAMLAQLRAADIAVETRPEWDDPAFGRFARIHDPEGNPVELWEPAPLPEAPSDGELEDHGSFDGLQQVWRHASRETGTPMTFSIYLPPAAKDGPAPLVWFLSGLTCNEQNFIIKSGFQRYASELGLMVVGPDTSPRGPALDGSEVAGDPDGQGEIGPSAGYYVDATQPPWAPHYRMRSYVEQELPELIAANFPADMARQGMCGHSMGGHGALTVSLRDPGRFRSTSVLAPISAPTKVESGRKRLRAYLGDDEQAWRAYDATLLLEDGARLPELLVDQGSDDALMERLRPDLLEAACREHGQPVEFRYRPGYGHNYYFVASVIGEHLRWHAERLR